MQENLNIEEKYAPIRTYYKKELKNLYDMKKYKTFNEAIKPLKDRIDITWNRRRIFSPREVQIIFEFLGRPLKNH